MRSIGFAAPCLACISKAVHEIGEEKVKLHQHRIHGKNHGSLTGTCRGEEEVNSHQTERTKENVTIDSKDSEAALSEKAKTLAAGISGKPTVGKTDATGGVIFDKLALGYYLVVVDNCESSSMKYQIAPAIVSVPVAEGSA